MYAFCSKIREFFDLLFDDTARSSSCPLLLSFLFNVNIIPATLSSSELAVVVPELGLGRRAGGWRQIPLQNFMVPKPGTFV